MRPRLTRIAIPCFSMFCAVSLLLSAVSVAQTQARNIEPALSVETIQPFRAHVAHRVLIDLRRRLGQTKWPDQLPGTTWEYGAYIAKVRELADYWQHNYDWRAAEARLNPEHRRILSCCVQPITVVDLASDTDLPVGVVRVLLSDLTQWGAITVLSAPRGRVTDERLLREVLHGLQAL